MKYKVGDFLVIDDLFQKFAIQIIDIKHNKYYYRYISDTRVNSKSIGAVENTTVLYPRYRLMNNEEKLELL